MLQKIGSCGDLLSPKSCRDVKDNTSQNLRQYLPDIFGWIEGLITKRSSTHVLTTDKASVIVWEAMFSRDVSLILLVGISRNHVDSYLKIDIKVLELKAFCEKSFLL